MGLPVRINSFAELGDDCRTRRVLVAEDTGEACPQAMMESVSAAGKVGMVVAKYPTRRAPGPAVRCNSGWGILALRHLAGDAEAPALGTLCVSPGGTVPLESFAAAPEPRASRFAGPAEG